MKNLKNMAFVTVLGMAGLTACGQSSNSTEASASQSEGVVMHVNASEFASMMAEEPGLLIDVRTPGEYASGHLEGSTLIDYMGEGFEGKLAELDKDQTVYVYCRSGGRSGNSARAMKEMGFTKVVDLSGGISAWEAAGNPVVKD